MGSNSEFTIKLNYPPSSSNEPRWGYGKPPHPILIKLFEEGIPLYHETLALFTEFRAAYEQIPIENSDQIDLAEPYWLNDWLPGLDALSLYCLIGLHKPSRYIEIGSGNSTKFARKSIVDNDLSTRIISIDPKPRVEIDAITDRVIRLPLEEINIGLFDCLEKNDILFIDNSHRSFMNSDVTVSFIDIIPRLQSGVLVSIHDIFLPYDYPPHWSHRFYNEQYLLAAYLLAKGNLLEIYLPCGFISHNDSLSRVARSLLSKLIGVSYAGGAFWMKIK